eukprot:SAG11_NODE_21965_length_415_cov_0.620253_1_plen_49_part_01
MVFVIVSYLQSHRYPGINYSGPASRLVREREREREKEREREREKERERE